MEQTIGDQGRDDTGPKITVRLVTPVELASILGVPVSWVYRHDELPCIRVGKYRRYTPDEVIAFLKKNGSQNGDGHEQKM